MIKKLQIADENKIVSHSANAGKNKIF